MSQRVLAKQNNLPHKCTQDVHYLCGGAKQMQSFPLGSKEIWYEKEADKTKASFTNRLFIGSLIACLAAFSWRTIGSKEHQNWMRGKPTVPFHSHRKKDMNNSVRQSLLIAVRSKWKMKLKWEGISQIVSSRFSNKSVRLEEIGSRFTGVSSVEKRLISASRSTPHQQPWNSAQCISICHTRCTHEYNSTNHIRSQQRGKCFLPSV